MRNWQKDMRAVASEIEELKGLRRGDVRIAVPQEAVSGFLPQVLGGFLRDHPRIATSVQVAESDRVRQMVIEGEADFGLTFSPRPLPGVTVLRDLSFRVLALLPEDDSARKSVTLERFFARPTLMPDGSSHLRDLLDIAAARAGTTLQPALSSNNLELLRQMVREGCGHGVLLAAGTELPRLEQGVQALPLRGAGLPPQMLALIAARDRSPALAAVLALRYIETAIDALHRRPGS